MREGEELSTDIAATAQATARMKNFGSDDDDWRRRRVAWKLMKQESGLGSMMVGEEDEEEDVSAMESILIPRASSSTDSSTRLTPSPNSDGTESSRSASTSTSASSLSELAEERREKRRRKRRERWQRELKAVTDMVNEKKRRVDVDAALLREKVKKLVRVSQWPIRDEVRLGLWRLLTRSKDSDTQAAFYRAQLEEHLKRTEAGLSRAKFVSDPAAVLNNQRLSEPGVVALTRLLHFVEVQRPEIESAPMLYPLGALFLHYMSEEDAYASLICLLSGKLVTTSDCEWAALPHVVLALVRRHKPHAYQALRRRAGTPATVAGDRELSATMRQFLVWIFGSLPLDYVIRVVDCYLVEGLKFLLRAAIALVYIWYKQHKTQSVPSDYADKEPRERMRLLRAELRESASRIGVSVETFIDVCVHIRNLQSTNILRLRHDWEIEVRPDVIRAREERASRRGAHAGWRSAQSSAAAAHVVPFVSKIVGADAAVELILALPQRFQLETPQLLFRLSEQGASFTRLWACVDEAEQTLLLIRSTSGARFGAFCSSSWAERNDRHNRTKTRYFGTGESWVWRLDEQLALPVIHQWVGLERSTDEDAPQMFMTANDKLLIVGSGGHDAIRIADELTTGLSGASTTFGTDGPLCASQENSLNKPKSGPTTTAGTPTNASGAFEIAELEVFEVRGSS